LNNEDFMTEKLTIRIDASSMGDLHCFLKFWRKVIEQYTTPKENVSMVFGSAWHVFREELAKSESESLSIGKAVRFLNTHIAKGLEIPDKYAHLTPAFLTLICIKYTEQFGTSDKTREFKFIRNEKEEPLVEYTFSIKVFEDDYVIIYLQGTIDEIGRFNNGNIIAFGDDKTTHSWNINVYLSQHKMKNQLRTYAWAIRHLAKEAEQDNPYKGIFSGRIGGFINGVFLNKDMEKIQFKRSDIFFFTHEDLQEYEDMLTEVCRALSAHVEHKLLPNRGGIMNNTCSGNFGDCPYIAICAAPSKDVGQRLLDSFFVKKSYEPLMFRK